MNQANENNSKLTSVTSQPKKKMFIIHLALTKYSQEILVCFWKTKIVLLPSKKLMMLRRAMRFTLFRKNSPRLHQKFHLRHLIYRKDMVQLSTWTLLRVKVIAIAGKELLPQSHTSLRKLKGIIMLWAFQRAWQGSDYAISLVIERPKRTRKKNSPYSEWIVKFSGLLGKSLWIWADW